MISVNILSLILYFGKYQSCFAKIQYLFLNEKIKVKGQGKRKKEDKRVKYNEA